MRGALGGVGTVAITRPVAFATAFMLLFSVVIALFKDIPDVAGDSKVGGRGRGIALATLAARSRVAVRGTRAEKETRLGGGQHGGEGP